MNRVKWSEMSEWMEMTWNNPMRKSLWVSWRCPYESDLSESENECPYQNEWNRWDLNELKWIERFEVKWVIWRIWLGTTLWESPYESVESVPMKVTWNEWFDQTLSKWSESIRNEWIEVNRVKWSEMSEMMDLMRWTLWKSPYGQ